MTEVIRAAAELQNLERIIVRQTERLGWTYILEHLRPLAELKGAPEIVADLERRRLEFGQ